jgi:hypothetical protein
VTNVWLPERGDPFGAVVDDFEEVIVECANLVTQFLDHGTDRFERHNFSLVGDRNLAMWCPRTPERLASALLRFNTTAFESLKTTENEVRGQRGGPKSPRSKWLPRTRNSSHRSPSLSFCSIGADERGRESAARESSNAATRVGARAESAEAPLSRN